MTSTQTPPLPYRRNPGCPYDPAQELRDLSAEHPVARVSLTSGLDVWLISRYADARRVLGDARISSGVTTPGSALPKPEDRTLEEELSHRQPGTFLEYDPPDHTRLRAVVAGEFTSGAMRRLRPRIEAITTSCLDATEAAGPPVDLVTTFALPLPSRVICEMLGLPIDDGFDFASHTKVMTDLMASAEELLVSRDAMRGYMRAHVEQQRHDPGDNILGRLILRHGDELDDEELVGIGNLLLIAGHETTAMMLGIGALAFLQHPEQMTALRDDPALVAGAVEELLRYISIANHGAVRTALQDIEVGGQLIKKGELLIVSIPLANRDETRYDDPYRFDVSRKPKRDQLAFGFGIHRCVAAPMARMELQIAFPALLNRFPNLCLAVPFEQIPVRTSNATHGVDALPVTW